MSQPTRRLSTMFHALVAAVAMLSTACDKPEFVVPPPPSTTGDGRGDNQPPPEGFEELGIVLRTPVSGPIDPRRLAAAESEGIAAAVDYLAAIGASTRDDFGVMTTERDAFGGFHVKMEQTYEGIPVIGGGLIAHVYDDRPTSISENLIFGVDVSPSTPRLPQAAAEAIALDAYPHLPAALVDVASRLAILPTLELVRLGPVGSTGAENAENYEQRLVADDLVWEVTVTPLLPDLVLETMAEIADVDPNTDESDRAARMQNATVGGHDVEETMGPDTFTSLIEAPPVRYRIDASSAAGEVLEIRELVEEYEGTGYGYYNGKVELQTSGHQQLDGYFLADGKRPKSGHNIVWDAENQETYDELLLAGDADNQWGDGSIYDTEGANWFSTRRQTPAVDVAFGIQIAWDLFDNVLYRDGFDDQGSPVNAAVHYGDGYTDAHYNSGSQFVVFGDNDAKDEAGNFSIQTVGHELGHRFWHAAGIASEDGESSALNEGHGDIMGSLVDFYKNTSGGEGATVRRFDTFANWASRVREPGAYEEKVDGKTYYGQDKWRLGLSKLPEHVGGIPFARAFVYIAEGAPPLTDDPFGLGSTEMPDGFGGIGITKAAHIWKHAIAHYVVGAPWYLKMRGAFGEAAVDLYGLNSMEHRAVNNAFAAIAVGSEWNDTGPPEITSAKLYNVNLQDMTAVFWATVEEDTGLEELRIEGHGNNGHYFGSWFSGYVDISEAPVGEASFTFEVEDGNGNTDSVVRTLVKARNRNLMTNGNFEQDMDGWTTSSGEDRVCNDHEWAFIGKRFLCLRGNERAYQLVPIPAGAEDVTLVLRMLMRNGTKWTDSLTIEIRRPDGSLLEILSQFTANTSTQGRTALNKGYLRYAYDLSAYAGQTIRIQFRNQTLDDAKRFLVDQVVLTYTEDVFADNPSVELMEWDNTVVFRLPLIQGLDSEEISRVEYYIDGDYRAAGWNPNADWYGSIRLDHLSPGPHWVGARIRGLDNQKLFDTGAVWFVPRSVDELLSNGDFEDDANVPWDLTYSSPPPNAIVLEKALDYSPQFDGQRAVRLGGTGEASESYIGQEVNIPLSLSTLTFSVRVHVDSTETASKVDELRLEIWNAETYERIEDPILVAGHHNQSFPHGWHDFEPNGYWRSEVELDPYLYSGKHVIVILRLTENAGKPTAYSLDNASLRYTQLGVVWK